MITETRSYAGKTKASAISFSIASIRAPSFLSNATLPYIGALKLSSESLTAGKANVKVCEACLAKMASSG